MKLPEDPVMLLSFVNTKLRDQYASLDALCDDLDAPRAALAQYPGLPVVFSGGDRLFL